jgi:hypothetical protein
VYKGTAELVLQPVRPAGMVQTPDDASTWALIRKEVE